MDGEAVTNLNMMPAAAATVMVTAQWMGLLLLLHDSDQSVAAGSCFDMYCHF
jgi:hypothetical protein